MTDAKPIAIREADHVSIPYPGSKRRDEGRISPLLGSGDYIVDPCCGMAHIPLRALEEGLFKHAVLGDASPYVTTVLKGIKFAPSTVYAFQVAVAEHIEGRCDRFKAWQARVSGDMKNYVMFNRAYKPAERAERAGEILGVMAWTFSRLWRVNGRGELNASMDPRGRPITSLKALERLSTLLQRALIVDAPWWETVGAVGRLSSADLIFLDAPYVPAPGVSGFVQYSGGAWTAADTVALAQMAAQSEGRIVACEQDPGGANIYLDTFEGASQHRWGLRRNVRGDQIAAPRSEVVIVREAVDHRRGP